LVLIGLIPIKASDLFGIFPNYREIALNEEGRKSMRKSGLAWGKRQVVGEVLHEAHADPPL
jgi:hypothetical protein